MDRRTQIAFTLCVVLGIGTAITAVRSAAAQAAPKMTFFITSAGPGNGANLGGIAGADKHCQTRAAAVGAGDRTWRAYLSVTGDGKQTAVNARDRIGKGPWYNAKGMLAAQNVADLHSAQNKLSKEVSLSEKGEMINGRGDNPNRHDILTGSQPDGSAVTGDPATTTCGNWTSGGEGSAMSVITIGREAARIQRRGTRRTRRRAAVRRTCRQLAATGCSTASRSKSNSDRAIARGGRAISQLPCAIPDEAFVALATTLP